jgi:hypothetical protein
MNKCRCDEISRLEENEAEDYERDHLVLLKVDLEKWTTLYQCPEGGQYWKEYLLNSYAHGGGSAQLVKVTKEQAIEQFGDPSSWKGSER